MINVKHCSSEFCCFTACGRLLPIKNSPTLNWRLCRISTSAELVLRAKCPNRSFICRSKAEKLQYLEHSGNSTQRKKLAVFVSGGGSNFQAIHKACEGGVINADIAVLVTNKADCGGAQYARYMGIPVILFPKSISMSSGLTSANLINALRRYGISFLLLAGYLRIIPVEIIQAYQRAIVNIHPSLLPAFGGKGCYGVNVHKAVIASGARYSGTTIHFVDEQYDTGRILAQRVVAVLANDTAESLAARVLEEPTATQIACCGVDCPYGAGA